ncbi:hypothetical protein ACIQM3_13005 [Streptomyces sp. NPDC091271]|uniref:hypothetical protein n=1 Tax=Streptomyces sp. NPDC091271 TaxID=3365980 RepID=UPI0037FFA066
MGFAYDEILRTLAPAARKALVRVLAVPLVLLLVPVAHPWTYLPSGDGGDAPYSAGASEAGSTTSDGEGGGADEPPPPSEAPATSEVPSASVEETAQARALDSVLEESAGYRTSVQSAVDDTSTCGATSGLEQSATTFREAATARGELADDVPALTLDQVRRGPDIKVLLQEALRLSATVDTHFADWATALDDGSCAPSSTTQQADYVLATGDANDAAASAKQDFVDVWNPIAETYSLRSWRADQF